MKIGIIGLGRMGRAITKRILNGGHTVIAYDPDEKARRAVKRLGAETVSSASEVANKARVVWFMVPAGKVVDSVIKLLLPSLKKGDVIIDGGNSFFENSIKRSKVLAKKGIHYLDCGTSGGVRGEEIGFSLMVGGEEKVFNKMKPIFKTIAAKNGFGYMGPSGTGHYVKMVHNGMEYALLQSYAEGFHLLKKGKYKNLDLGKVADVWNNGGIVRSFILELLSEILHEDQSLRGVPGAIGENKTGRWTSDESKKRKVPTGLIDLSLKVRAQSRKTGGDYGTKVVAMLRNKFGGHPLEKKKK